MKLAVGKYKATVTVNKAYRDYFKIDTYDGAVKLNVTVQQSDGGGHGVRGCFAGKKTAAASSVAPKPNAARPAGKAAVPKGPKPDLRAVPAWGSGRRRARGDAGSGQGLPAVLARPCGTRARRRSWWTVSGSRART